jgi:2-keto-myo-inositol isomerase
MNPCLNGATTMPYSLEDDIAAAARAGFQGIEIWWDKLRKYLETHSPEELKELLKRNEIVPVGVCPAMVSPFRNTEAARERYKKAVEATQQIGADVLTIGFDCQPARLTQDEALAEHTRELKEYARIAADRGIRLCLEALGRHSLVPGPREALMLIEAVGAPPHIGLVMDTFHYFKSRVSYEDIRAIPLDRLFLVHVNDCEDQPLDELTDAHRCFPTLGVIPLQKQLSILVEKGYDGYLSVETFRPSYWEEPIDDIARKAFYYYNQLIQVLEHA